MTGPNRAQRRAWPKRRDWLDRIATDSRLTSGAKAWLMLLARRSDDSAKPVWGRQTRQAADIGRSDRSVRSYRLEAEQLGYVATYRSKPQRGPDGRWGRRRTNRYYLLLPAREAARKGAPRRRRKAPYCVVPVNRRRSGHLPENNGRSNPLRGRPTAPDPPWQPIQEAATNPEPQRDPALARQYMAEMRASLQKARLEPAGRRG